MTTYPTDFFEIGPVASEMDELLVEEPGELEVQRGVVGHLAGQHDALTHRHVQMPRGAGDDRGLWEHAAPNHRRRASQQQRGFAL